MLHLNFTPFPTLHTQRLILRPFRSEDVHNLFRLRSDPAVTQYFQRPGEPSLADAQARVDKISDGIARNEMIGWVMALKDDPALVGTIGFHKIYTDIQRAEVGYLLDPALWGKKLMSEALQAVMDYGARIMRLRSIEAQVNPENKASLSLLAQNGFKEESYRKEDVLFEGVLYDTVVYSIQF